MLGHLSQVVLQEGHRLKAWGILGTGTGAELLRTGELCLGLSQGLPGNLVLNQGDQPCRNSSSTLRHPAGEER